MEFASGLANGAVPITIVLIDDHALFQEGLVAILSRETDLKIIGVGNTSDDAVGLAKKLHPSILLLDVELNDAPATTTIRRVRRTAPVTRVIVLTMYRDQVLRRELLRTGASAYINKAEASGSLIASIRAVYTGRESESDFGSSAVQQTAPQAQLLSRRESEVLRLVARALTNRDIARELSITEGTTKRHISVILEKLGARSRLDAVQKAARLGLLNDG